MNYNNKEDLSFSFPINSWSTLISRYNRQLNCENSANTTESNLNKQNNVSVDFSSQNQSNNGGNNFNNLNNQVGADSESINTIQYNNQLNNNSDSYQQNSNNFLSQQNQRSSMNLNPNPMNNNSDSYQQNSNNIGSQQNQRNSVNFNPNPMNNNSDSHHQNSNNFGSLQNQQNSLYFNPNPMNNNSDSYQQNSNNIGSQQNQRNSVNFNPNPMNNNSDSHHQNSNNFGSLQNQQNSLYFNPNPMNNNSDSYQKNSNNFGSQSNQRNSINFNPNQNRTNSNNFGARKYQSNFSKKKSKNQSLTWLPGSGPGSGCGNGSFDNANGGNNNNRSNNVSIRKFRQYFANRQINASNDNTPPPSLFMGRDQSYPNELNALMNPFFCGVCNSRLNSIKSANIHYESKAHDKHITNWIKKNFTDKGLAVPEIHRFVTEETIGPYRCELCKVDLTSPQHALQHNNGKRHRQAASKISPPTGIGYYNVDGNWVETGKVLDKVTGKEASYILVNTPSGFEPVVLHVAPNTVTGVKRSADSNTNNSEELPEKKSNLEVQPHDAEKEKLKIMKEEQYRTMLTDYEKNKKQENNSTNPKTSDDNFKVVKLESQESSSSTQTPQEALNSLKCKICGVTTTSYDQMLLHLKGIRHTKKLRALGEPPLADMFDKAPTSILASLDSNSPSDVSMYRTPTGSYYCKTCNIGLEDIARIKKHISSKAHLAEVKKSSNMPVKC